MLPTRQLQVLTSSFVSTCEFVYKYSQLFVCSALVSLDITLNKSPLQLDACLKLMPGVNQQIMTINVGPQLDSRVSCTNTTCLLQVVRVKKDGREEKVLRRLV